MEGEPTDGAGHGVLLTRTTILMILATVCCRVPSRLLRHAGCRVLRPCDRYSDTTTNHRIYLGRPMRHVRLQRMWDSRSDRWHRHVYDSRSKI